MWTGAHASGPLIFQNTTVAGFNTSVTTHGDGSHAFAVNHNKSEVLDSCRILTERFPFGCRRTWNEEMETMCLKSRRRNYKQKKKKLLFKLQLVSTFHGSFRSCSFCALWAYGSQRQKAVLWCQRLSIHRSCTLLVLESSPPAAILHSLLLPLMWRSW